MVDREGGQWNVASKGGAVYLERVSEDGERLFEDALDAEAARALGELLTRHADKVENSDRAGDDDSRKSKDDSGKSKDDSGKSKDEDDESDDDDDESEDDDEDDSDSGSNDDSDRTSK